MAKKDFTNKIGLTRTSKDVKNLSISTAKLMSKETIQSNLREALAQQNELEAPREEIKEASTSKQETKREVKPKAPSTAKASKVISFRVSEEEYNELMERFNKSEHKKFIDFIKEIYNSYKSK